MATEYSLVNLKDWHKEFCMKVAGGMRQTDAVREARPETKSPNKIASKLLSNPNIKAEIERCRQELGKLSNMSPERIIENIVGIATKGEVESNKLRALELLAKIKGMIGDKGQVAVNIINGERQAISDIIAKRTKVVETVKEGATWVQKAEVVGQSE